MSKAEFYFRVWVSPENSDPPVVEVWYPGIEVYQEGKCLVSDWVKEAMENEDHYALFDLDKTKYWQVVGRALLREDVSYLIDYWGEYSEELDILEYKKEEAERTMRYLFLDETLTLEPKAENETNREKDISADH